MKRIAVLAVIFWLLAEPVFGGELKGEISRFDYKGAQEEFFEETGIKIDFGEFVYGAVTGDGFWERVKSLIIKRVLGEGLSSLKGIRLLIVMGILGGFLKNLTESFSNKATAEAGFWVCYMLCAGLGMGALLPMISLMKEFCGECAELVEGCLPLMLTVITAGGSPVEAISYGGLVEVSAGVTAKGAELIMAPLLQLSAVLCIVNYISEEEALGKLFSVLKKAAEWAIKGGAVLFGFVCSLCKIGSAAGGGVVRKGAGAVVEMVPVAGDVIKGSLDAGAAVLGAVKSGTGIVFVVLIGIYGILPILKVLATGFAFKAAAGLIEPVCDKRIVGLIDSLGDLTFLILGVIFLVSYVFMFGALVFVAAAWG